MSIYTITPDPSTPTEASKAPELEIALSELEKYLAMLYEVFETLQSRLEPVSVDIPVPANSDMIMASNTEQHSRVVNRIRALANSVNEHRKKVNGVLQRLEV